MLFTLRRTTLPHPTQNSLPVLRLTTYRVDVSCPLCEAPFRAHCLTPRSILRSWMAMTTSLPFRLVRSLVKRFGAKAQPNTQNSFRTSGRWHGLKKAIRNTTTPQKGPVRTAGKDCPSITKPSMIPALMTSTKGKSKPSTISLRFTCSIWGLSTRFSNEP